MTRRHFAATAVFLILIAARPSAAEPVAPQLAPASQPLAVVRAARPDLAWSLFESRQFRHLGLADFDYSGPLPGFRDVAVDSLKTFLKNTGEFKSEDFWLCLAQTGRTSSDFSPVMGWTWADSAGPRDEARFRAWLERNGLAGEVAVAVRQLPNYKIAVAVAKNGEALGHAIDGPRNGNEAWRGRLDAFLRRPGATVGIWVNPRPLAGALALATGFDLRAATSSIRVGMPATLECELVNHGGELGLDVRMDDMFQSPVAESPDFRLGFNAPLPMSAQSVVVRLSLHSPATLIRDLGLIDRIPYLSRVDLEHLLPRVAVLDLWKNADGGVDWRAVCLVGRRPGHRKKLARINAWLDLFAASPATGLAIEETTSPYGDPLRRLTVGDRSLVMGGVDTQERPDGGAFLVLAGREENYPPTSQLWLVDEPGPRFLSWSLQLDLPSRAEGADLLAALAAKHGVPVPARQELQGLLARFDSGQARAEGGTLVLSTRNGTTPLIAPMLSGMLAETVGDARERIVLRQVERRLRFLLQAAARSRFRRTGADGRVPGAWPDSLAAIVADAGDASWLDRELPHPPERGAKSSKLVAALASGTPAAGFVFRIEKSESDWAVVAEGGKGEQLRIDRRGVIRREETEK